jgi:hypothetical protein
LPLPFLSSELGASKRRLIRVVREAHMENLGLDPSQSETQYLQAIFQIVWKRQQRGNGVAALLPLEAAILRKGAVCCLFVAASVASLLPLGMMPRISGNKAATVNHLPKIQND